MSTESRVVDAVSFAPPKADLAKVQRTALIVGVAFSALLAVGYFVDAAQFMQSYLIGFLFWFSVAIGSAVLSMVHHLSRGAWGVMIRRIFEASSRTLPLVAILFVPVALGMKHLFVWTNEEIVRHDEILLHKQPYLNTTSFLVRAVIYFVVWFGFSFALDRLSKEQDDTGNPALFRKMQTVAAVGIGLVCIGVTFAAVDWLLSLNPKWSSTMYGVYFLGGSAIAALAFTVLVVNFLSKRKPMSGVFLPAHYHDYGKFLFAFVMLFSYFSISQFLIIWSGNLPEEIFWYKDRLEGGWGSWGMGLIILHFAIPFCLLLSRARKRNIVRLSMVAVWLLVVRWYDLIWQVVPAFHPGVLHLSWMDVVAPIALGGLWVAAFAMELGKRPLLPIHEPYLKEALGDG